jgi:uncharacterized protein (TIGR03437 family)
MAKLLRAFPALFLLLGSTPSTAQRIITTAAGRDWVMTGIGQNALNAPLGTLNQVATDSAGNVYFGDEDNQLVLRVDAVTNIITVFAGNGLSGFTGDGSAATSASLAAPTAIVFDNAGNAYIADGANNRIRKVTPDGNITTIAGTGAAGYSGDGGPAVKAVLNEPIALAVDAAGNLYFCDNANNRVRKIDTRGLISTVAGNGRAAETGDGGSAMLASISGPDGIAVDPSGTVYIADFAGNRVRSVTPDGVIHTLAGTGGHGFTGDGGPATAATIEGPVGLAVDSKGNVLISDTNNCRIRVVDAKGTIQTLVGDDTCQPAGPTAVPQATATLFFPQGIAFDPKGNLLITDAGGHVKKLGLDGTLAFIAGNGLYRINPPNVQPAQAVFSHPLGLAPGATGSIYLASRNNNFVYQLDPAKGTVNSVTGRGFPGRGSEGVPAVTTLISSPECAALDGAGNLYFSDVGNNRIAKIGADGTMHTVAGRYTPPGYAGDGGPAGQASINRPLGVATDQAGNVFFADSNNHRIRKITLDGNITTVAGNGNAGYTCDNCPATSSSLNAPVGIALDTAGNLYIADTSNNRVRKVTPGGTITTVAGNGINASSNDGGPASQASVSVPGFLALDAGGNLYISEYAGNRVRMVSTSGIITTVAGNGIAGYAGDGGPATGASFNGPAGLMVDAAGTLYIADSNNDRIRSVITVSPSYTLSASGLSFAAVAHGTAPAPQLLNLTSLLGTAPSPGLPFTATITGTGDTSWLQVTPLRGLMPAALTVTANPANLNAGSFQATVTVNAPGAQTATQSFTVSLTVSQAAQPKLSVQPANFTFSFVPGGAAQSAQLNLSNQGAGSLDFTAVAATTAGGSWLKVSPGSGTADSPGAAVVTLAVDAGSLPQGTYTGSVTLASKATGQNIVVPVTTTVSSAVSHVLLSQSGLTFTSVSGGGNALPQTIGVLNTGKGSMNWQAVAAAPAGEPAWLSISPASGSVNRPFLDVSQLTISVDAKGLAPGDHYGQIQVSAPGADNGSQSILILLSVLPAGSPAVPQVQPTNLVFTGVQGATPGSQTIRLGDPNPTPLAYNSSRLTVDGANWFVHVPTNSTITPSQPASVVVQPDFTQLAPGIYNGAITFQFADGNVNVVKILTVVAAAGSGSSRSEPDAACSPSQLNILPTATQQTFAARLNQPTSLAFQVLDNCGQALTYDRGGAAVTMSFSNGDRAMSLAPSGGGTWSATWVPQSAPNGPVKASVTAFLALPGGKILANQIDMVANIGGTAPTPVVTPGGVLNAASFQSDAPIAPGGLITIYGTQLADGPGQSFTTTPVPTSLNGTQVRVGGQVLPLFYSSTGQVNAQVPFGLAVNTQLQLSVTHGSALSVPQSVTVAAAQPAIFATNQQGTGQGAIVNGVTFELADATHPVHAGDVISIYCTGLGAVSPAVPEGALASLTTLSSTVAPVSVSIGGSPAKVDFAGLAPGFAGLYQVNAEVPAGIAQGDQVAVVIGIAGQVSPALTISVR